MWGHDLPHALLSLLTVLDWVAMIWTLSISPVRPSVGQRRADKAVRAFSRMDILCTDNSLWSVKRLTTFASDPGVDLWYKMRIIFHTISLSCDLFYIKHEIIYHSKKNRKICVLSCIATSSMRYPRTNFSGKRPRYLRDLCHYQIWAYFILFIAKGFFLISFFILYWNHSKHYTTKLSFIYIRLTP